MKIVTIFSKPGCHLCDEAEVVARRVAMRREFGLVKKNILEEAELQRKYQLAIPVIVVDGREIARHRLTEKQLEAALEG